MEQTYFQKRMAFAWLLCTVEKVNSFLRRTHVNSDANRVAADLFSAYSVCDIVPPECVRNDSSWVCIRIAGRDEGLTLLHWLGVERDLCTWTVLAP